MDLGAEVRSVDAFDSSLNFEMIRREIESFDPHFSLLHNLYAFDVEYPWATDLKEYFRNSQRRVASWFIDDPFVSGSTYLRERFFSEPPLSFCHFFCVDRSFLAPLRELGLEASYLPMAIDRRLELQRIEPVDAFRHDLNLIATPMFKDDSYDLSDFEKLEKVAANYARAELVMLSMAIARQKGVPQAMSGLTEGLSKIYREFFSRMYTTRKDFEGARDHLWKQVKTRLPEKLIKPFPIFRARLDTVYSYFQMTSYAQFLEPHGLTVYGGEAWKYSVPRAAKSSRFLSLQEMAQVFRSSVASFCYTKWTFPTSVVERPLLVLAAGGFPLTDFREDVPEFFGEGNIAIYRTIGEAVELMKKFKQDEKTREAMIMRARARIFESQTFHERAREMLRVMVG